MRLAQFVRGPTGGNGLHGLPEMEVGRSPTAAGVESSSGGDPSMPLLGSESGGRTPLTASSIAAAAAAAAAGVGFGPSGRGGAISPEDVASPTLLPTLTPARVRNDGEDDINNPGRRVSGRQSNRSSGTLASPAFAGGMGGWAEPETGGGVIGALDGGKFGMGPEAAAQAFTEEAELEALQIDKNDLKLVFGRPFARGKSSEVYQVTHEGRNRAAKVCGGFVRDTLWRFVRV